MPSVTVCDCSIRSRAGVAGQSDEESQQLYLSKQMLEKLRDLRLKARRIEASQSNPKKKAQMLMALAKVCISSLLCTVPCTYVYVCLEFYLTFINCMPCIGGANLCKGNGGL